MCKTLLILMFVKTLSMNGNVFEACVCVRTHLMNEKLVCVKNTFNE